MITKTVGTGGDYPNFNAGLHALDYLVRGPLSDDVTLDVISNISEPSYTKFFRSIQLNGHTLRITSSYNQSIISDWQNWYKITAVGTEGLDVYIDGNLATKTGALQIDHLYVIGNPGGWYPFVFQLTCFNGAITTTSIYNSYFDGISSSVAYGVIISTLGTTTIYNCKIWDGNYGLVFSNLAAGTINTKNVTVYGATQYSVFSRGTGTRNFTNVVSTRNGTSQAYNKSLDDGTVVFNFTNCAADDASITATADSQTNCLENIVPADEFVSLDDTNAEFLFPKSGGNIATGGIDAGYSTDIVGSPIPGPDGLYSIGCHEFQGTPSIKKVINGILPIDGLLVIYGESALKNGLFAHRLDKEVLSESDFLEMVDDASSLGL